MLRAVKHQSSRLHETYHVQKYNAHAVRLYDWRPRSVFTLVSDPKMSNSSAMAIAWTEYSMPSLSIESLLRMRLMTSAACSVVRVLGWICSSSHSRFASARNW
jgi:hypothetical protein